MTIRNRVACTLLVAAGLAAGTAVNAAGGDELYREHCMKCHGEAGRADTWRGLFSFAQDFTDRHYQRNTTDEEILRAINRGPRIMPAYEKTLSPEEREALVNVVREFGK